MKICVSFLILDVCGGDNEVYASAYSAVAPPFVAVGSNNFQSSYVWYPEGLSNCQTSQSCGKATFLFSCSESTVVTFKVEGSAPNSHSDSFYIAVDGGAPKTWYYPNTNDWHWDTFQFEYSISEGLHQLHVLGREAGIKLRRVGMVKGKDKCCFRIYNDPGIPRTFLEGVHGLYWSL